MFTGIIEATAKVTESENGTLVLERPKAFTDIKEGSSIAVSGVCLSVVYMNKKCIHFNVVPETKKRTTLGSYQKGNLVNLERAMRADGRLDGHVVQGHVEGVGEVVKKAKSKKDGETLLVIFLPRDLLPFVVPKGSIAIDGVSLTVASLHNALVTVALIPHTMERTTLGSLEKGDRVNIETDILARYAQKQKDESLCRERRRASA